MIWNLTGNQWLDNKFRQIIDFSMELDSCACRTSPLEPEDIENIRKCIDILYKINQRLTKRVNKKRK
jgi:macrodomain Ter protein organizer (MatP/YcbG family)